MPIVPDIISQHAEEAAFLWILRDLAVHAPHYRLKDLAKLDRRVDAHLDGLRIAGDEGWNVVVGELKWKEPGEIFAAAVLALKRGDGRAVQAVLEAATPDPTLHRGFASALGWVGPEIAEPWVKKLVVDVSADRRHIAIAASAALRLPLDHGLLRDDSPMVRARAMRACGELADMEAIPVLERAAGDDDERCRFWSAWSRSLLDSTQSVGTLLEFAESSSELAMRAADLVFRRLSPTEADPIRSRWAQRPEKRRVAIQSAGVGGDPATVPWLLDRMREEYHARVAGEAFAMITGADLAYEDLDRRPPEEPVTGPSERPEDEDVSLDPDEDLSWPHPDRCEQWWRERSSTFREGVRHLVGQPIRTAHLQKVLSSGFQRQRAAASLELSIRRPGTPLFEVRAPGWLQRTLLGSG